MHSRWTVAIRAGFQSQLHDCVACVTGAVGEGTLPPFAGNFLRDFGHRLHAHHDATQRSRPGWTSSTTGRSRRAYTGVVAIGHWTVSESSDRGEELAGRAPSRPFEVVLFAGRYSTVHIMSMMQI